MKKSLLILFCSIFFLNHSFAQVCWLSGPTFLVGEGTGVHASEMPILAIQDLMVDSIPKGGAGIGSFFIEDIKFKTQFNKSSVGFFTAFRTGTNNPTMTIRFWYQRPDGVSAAWTTIVLTDVIVSGYKILAPECSSGTSCNIPSLEISLNWRKMTISDDFGSSSTLNKSMLTL